MSVQLASLWLLSEGACVVLCFPPPVRTHRAAAKHLQPQRSRVVFTEKRNGSARFLFCFFFWRVVTIYHNNASLVLLCSCCAFLVHIVMATKGPANPRQNYVPTSCSRRGVVEKESRCWHAIPLAPMPLSVLVYLIQVPGIPLIPGTVVLLYVLQIIFRRACGPFPHFPFSPTSHTSRIVGRYIYRTWYMIFVRCRCYTIHNRCPFAGSRGVAGAHRGDQETREGVQIRRQGEVGFPFPLFFP